MGSSGVLVMSNPMTAPNDIIVGGTAGAPTRLPKGANNSVLGVDGSGGINYNTSQMGSQNAILLDLDFKTIGDVLSNTTLTANTPANISGNRTFTVQNANSFVEVIIRVGVFNTSTPAASGETQSWITVDGVRYNLGAAGGNAFGNPLSGAGPIYINGLAVGSHTLAVLIMSNATTAGWYCRCSTFPTLEHLTIQVIEHKANVGLKGDGLVWRGVWTSGTTYAVNDAVNRNNSSYVALLPGSNQDPVSAPTYWQYLAQGGTALGGGPKLQLDYSSFNPPVDLANGTALTANTALRLPSTPLSFTVDRADSLVEISARGQTMLAGTTATYTQTDLWIDNTSRTRLGGFYIVSAGAYVNAFSGGDTIYLSGLTAGTHTVNIGFMSGAANNLYIRSASIGYEHISIQVIEHKLGGLSWTSRGAWSSATNYSVNDVVTYNGASYLCIQNHTNQTPAPATAYWALVAAKGDSFVWRGPWNSSATYAVNDVVTQGGGSYIAIQAGTNQDPTTAPLYWNTMTQPGSMANPMTGPSDMIIGGTGGAPLRFPKGGINTLLGVDGSSNLGYRQATGADIATSSALNISSLTASTTGTAISAPNGAVFGATGLSTNGFIQTQVGVSGAYFNGGNNGQGDLRANILRAGAAIISDAYVNAGTTMNAGGAIAAGGRVTGQEAGGWGIYASQGGVLAAGTVQGNALYISGGGTAIQCPSGNVSFPQTLTVGNQVQSSRNDYTAFYGTGSASGIYCAGGTAYFNTINNGAYTNTGQLHINNITTYGGGSSATCQGFFYLVINGTGWKVPLFQ